MRIAAIAGIASNPTPALANPAVWDPVVAGIAVIARHRRNQKPNLLGMQSEAEVRRLCLERRDKN
jgi:hypothetical protein